MPYFTCKKCKTIWDGMFLLEGNICKHCGSVCIELRPSEEKPITITHPKKSLQEFLNDNFVNIETLKMRRKCDREGHLPYAEDGQGMDGQFHGCYCGWIQLSSPANRSSKVSWSDLGL